MAPRSGNSRIWRSDPGIPGSGALGSGNPGSGALGTGIPGSGSRILEFLDLSAGSWNSRIWRPGIGNSRIWRPGVGKSRILAPRAGIPDLAPGRLGEAAGTPVSLGNPPRVCKLCTAGGYFPREIASGCRISVFFGFAHPPRAPEKCTFLTHFWGVPPRKRVSAL